MCVLCEKGSGGFLMAMMGWSVEVVAFVFVFVFCFLFLFYNKRVIQNSIIKRN